MSWNIMLAFLPDATSTSLPLADEPLEFDEIAMSDGAAAAEVPGGLVIVDPFAEAPELAAAAGAQLFSVMIGGTADVYAIEAVGAINRSRVLTEGEIVEDQGDPLPAEAVLNDHEFAEDGHIAVFEQLSGVSFDELYELTFHNVLPR